MPLNEAQSTYLLVLKNTSQYKQIYYFVQNAFSENWEIMGDCFISFVLQQQIQGFFCKFDFFFSFARHAACGILVHLQGIDQSQALSS